MQWKLTKGGSAPRILPLLPLFPGFAINTILYAAIVWVLFAVPGAVRRRVRRKRGQCALCGYSMRGSVGNVCPECGAAVASGGATGRVLGGKEQTRASPESITRIT
jgi:hypothetical protein